MTVWCVMSALDTVRRGQGQDAIESIWSTQDLAESALDVAKAYSPTCQVWVQPWVVDAPPSYQEKS